MNDLLIAFGVMFGAFAILVFVLGRVMKRLGVKPTKQDEVSHDSSSDGSSDMSGIHPFSPWAE